MEFKAGARLNELIDLRTREERERKQRIDLEQM